MMSAILLTPLITHDAQSNSLTQLRTLFSLFDPSCHHAWLTHVHIMSMLPTSAPQSLIQSNVTTKHRVISALVRYDYAIDACWVSCCWLERFACMKATTNAQMAIVWTVFSAAQFINNASCYKKKQPLIDLGMKCIVRRQKNNSCAALTCHRCLSCEEELNQEYEHQTLGEETLKKLCSRDSENLLSSIFSLNCLSSHYCGYSNGNGFVATQNHHTLYLS